MALLEAAGLRLHPRCGLTRRPRYRRHRAKRRGACTDQEQRMVQSGGDGSDPQLPLPVYLQEAHPSLARPHTFAGCESGRVTVVDHPRIVDVYDVNASLRIVKR